jgi:murein DD-endopeptidase MepM/ murein hydrolase activator NlpD
MAGWDDSGFGYCVKIKHANGVTTLYAHMKKNSLKVNKGDTVTQGQAIGIVGSTGNSTAPHLHFEVHENGSRVDPRPYLRGEK